jgi:O-antigen/teichoic acid export membrane protein
MATSRELITFLFTDAYAASAPIFAVWVLTIALSVLQTDGVMRVHAQIRFLFFVNLVRLALIVALIQPMMAAFGLIGPVLITLLAMALAKGLHLFQMRRLMTLATHEVLPWRDLAKVLAVSALAAAPVLLLRGLLVGPRPLLLLAFGLVYVIAYIGLLFAAGIISTEERMSLRRWLRLQAPSPLVTEVR